MGAAGAVATRIRLTLRKSHMEGAAVSFETIGIILVAVATASGAQLLLRYGMRDATEGRGLYSVVRTAISSPEVLGGLAIFAISALFWLWALSKAPLSIVYPFNGLAFIVILVTSHYLLRERLSAFSIAGAVLVAVGIGLVAIGA